MGQVTHFIPNDDDDDDNDDVVTDYNLIITLNRYHYIKLGMYEPQ